MIFEIIVLIGCVISSGYLTSFKIKYPTRMQSDVELKAVEQDVVESMFSK